MRGIVVLKDSEILEFFIFESFFCSFLFKGDLKNIKGDNTVMLTYNIWHVKHIKIITLR